MRWTPLAYVVWCHFKKTHVSPGYGAYLSLDEEVITRATIVDSKMNLRYNQEALDKVYLVYSVVHQD